MSDVQRRYCVFGCSTAVRGVPLHRFPNREKHPQLFAEWVSAAGHYLRERDPKRIAQNKRICDHHFDPSKKLACGRLFWSAVPTINLHCVKQSISTIVEIDHNYSRPRREFTQPLADVTNLPGPSSAFSVPSGSSALTCLTAAEKTSPRSNITRFDADKTFEYLLQKNKTNYVRKERRTQNEIRRLRRKVKNLRARLRQQQKVASTRDFERLTRKMSEAAKMFTRMQFMEGPKRKHGRRFTQEEKILALSMFKKSPKAYKLMCKHFTLPSRKILKELLAKVKIAPGINPIVFKELKNTVNKMMPQDRLCTLIFDEMSISPQLQYNVYTDDLVGFEDYGNGEKSEHFANHVLVFMVKGVKRNFKQPVAYYFVQALKTIKLKEILNDVITNILATGLSIVATVCDQSSANVSTINNLVADAKKTYFREGKEWRKDIIINNNKEIIPLFDPPHLIKGMRNNLINKQMVYLHNNTLKTIKWEDFQRVYEADRSHGELRLLPKLTNEHIDPQKIKKMRVKNAVQVFSFSMAVATDNLVARGSVPPECENIVPFVLVMDKLLDTLNASSFSIQNGKIYRAAVKRNSPHHMLWQEAIQMLKSVKFLVSRNDFETHEKIVPTITNLIKTIEGFKSVWQLLVQKYGFDAMLTRNFNQDPLENFFGSIRSLGARNIINK